MFNKKDRKGIILAGGKGTRLYPLTKHISKQLLPIYNKPMIYYPLFTLIDAGIKDILIIINPGEKGLFKRLLGNGNDFGIKIRYELQPKPNGIAEAFIIGEKFIDNHPISLILGDNIFLGGSFNNIIQDCMLSDQSSIFLKKVKDPNRYGVAKIDKKGRLIKIIEKPKNFISNYAVTGLYNYDENVVNYTKKLVKSERGELEITDLNQLYIDKGDMHYFTLDDSISWFDAGTHEALLEVGNLVYNIEKN